MLRVWSSTLILWWISSTFCDTFDIYANRLYSSLQVTACLYTDRFFFFGNYFLIFNIIVSLLAVIRNFSLLQITWISSGAQPVSYSLCTGGSSLGVKQPGSESNHFSPSNAEVGNEWSYISAPTMPTCCAWVQLYLSL